MFAQCPEGILEMLKPWRVVSMYIRIEAFINTALSLRRCALIVRPSSG